MTYIGWDGFVSIAESMSWQSSGESSIRRNAPESCWVDGENLSSSSLIMVIMVRDRTRLALRVTNNATTSKYQGHYWRRREA